MSTVGGYELCLRRIRDFLGDLADDEMAAVHLGSRVLDTKDRRIDMLNSKYLIVSQWHPQYLEFRQQPDRFRLLYSTGDCDVYENLKSLDPAFVVPATGVEVIPDDATALGRLKNPDFDPLKSVVLEKPLPETIRAAGAAATGSTKPVEWLSRRSGDFELNVEAGDSGVLVVSQIFYPGWRAFIDEQPAKVMPANFALTAIPITAGAHRVRFEFYSPAFRIGLLISVVTLTILAGVWFKAIFTKRRGVLGVVSPRSI
jgi:hypothetical protein